MTEVARVRFDAVWSGDAFLGPTAFDVRGDRLLLAPAESGSAPALELGGTLFPRLTDHHTHLGLTDPSALFAGGITHAIDLGWDPSVSSAWLADTPGHPTVRIAGALITAPGGYPANAGWCPPGSWAEVDSPGGARDAVREQVMAGASLIKATLNTDAGETVDDATLAAIVQESHAAGLPVAVHAQGDGQTARAVRARVDQLAHTPFTERVDDDTIEAAVAQGMSWITTLDIHGWGDPTEHHRIAVENLRRFARAGGTVLYGTDLGNGPLPAGVNPRELGAMLDAGLDATALLRSIAGDSLPAELGPRFAWTPATRPGDDAGLPAWLATARGLTVADLTGERAGPTSTQR